MKKLLFVDITHRLVSKIQKKTIFAKRYVVQEACDAGLPASIQFKMEQFNFKNKKAVKGKLQNSNYFF